MQDLEQQQEWQLGGATPACVLGKDASEQERLGRQAQGGGLPQKLIERVSVVIQNLVLRNPSRRSRRQRELFAFCKQKV